VTEKRFTGIRLDAQAIRVLAHPLRSRLLSQLRTGGPATATELAAALSTNTGATSYHLRKLEAVGLVTDTGEGEGKRRLWRASTDYHSWTNSAFRDDEDTATALDWLQRDYVRQQAQKAERWLDAASSWPTEWVDVFGLSDTFVTVTPEQMRELNTRLDALLAEYRTIGEGDPRARRASVDIFARPLDPDIVPDSDGPDSDGPDSEGAGR
jgi:DNA-binding transcriptional ArsR family regulator